MAGKGKSRTTFSIQAPSWIFGSLFAVFVLGVFLFAPDTLPEFKQKLLAYICALLAGFFAFFFTGTLALRIEGGSGQGSKIVVRAAGGLAAFVLTLWWWTSSAAPVKPNDRTQEQPPSSALSASTQTPNPQLREPGNTDARSATSKGEGKSTTAEKVRVRLDDLRIRATIMEDRVKPILASLQKVNESESLKSDIATALRRVTAYIRKAEQSLSEGAVSQANRYMDMAEKELGFLDQQHFE